MLHLRFSDARTWRYMMASIEKILDDGVFVANEEGLMLRALDPSRVVMVDLFYPSDSFSIYEVEGDEFSFGVSFNVFSRVLRRAKKDDQLELRVDESFIDVKFVGRGSRRFRIPQISLSYERPGEPRITFTVMVRMVASAFREAIRTVEPIAETLRLVALDEDRFLMRGRGDLEQAELEFSLSKQSLLEYQVDSPDESSYSVEYFSQMVQAAQAADVAVIEYSADVPVKVTFEYTGGGRLVFYVSPTIE